MTHHLRTVAGTLAVAGLFTASAAHASFTYPAPGRWIDSETTLEWAETTDPTALLAEGFHAATTEEAKALLLDSGLAGPNSYGEYWGQHVGRAASATNALGGLSFVGCSAGGMLAQCHYVGLLAPGAGEALPAVLSLVYSQGTPDAAGNLPPSNWRATFTDTNTRFGLIPNFNVLAQSADGTWYTGYQFSSEPPRLVQKAPHLMVRAVPEPATWLSTAFGLAGIGALRRGRRTRR